MINYITAGAAALIFIVILFLVCYVKTSPDVALVVSGWPRKKPKTLIGTGGIRIPGLQKTDKLYLGQLSVDIKAKSIPTNDFINVNVDAVAKVRVNPELISVAAANFLGRSADSISREIQDSLEGNMREVIGAIKLEPLNTNRDKFSDEIMNKAAKDMEKLGIEILSCNIQNITDENGLIRDLGADNTFAIKKNAAITKALAERDIAQKKAIAEREANDTRVENETVIAERNQALAIKKADLKVVEDTRKAVADAAYEIQKQEQQKTINEKTVIASTTMEILANEKQKEINAAAVEAETEKARKEQELTAERIKIERNKLSAAIERKADAEKYQKEIDAAAALEQRKREAEAQAYEAEQQAKAMKAIAEAEYWKMNQEAQGKKAIADAAAYEIEQRGIAEASAIEKKGVAEAEAMRKKADAFKEYGDAAKAQMVIEKLPEIAAAVAQPISSIQDVRIYGSNGDGVSQMSGQVPTVIKQTMDTVADATGVDMTKIMEASTLEAAVKKTQKN